ncbi:TPA: hypothetical protein NKV59_004437 [Vibrio parahaemolyticus]|uniref:hypothetical protein n=1 Tax=Vibrio parahaemolyticus TaxID=670 RepID=UPI00112198A8|nr:hypothetical protein [Vibrio parahaemolyticus]TOF18300.1 hypothetical protein CGJ26_23905 [Vibrio parahaemolyticus]HCH4140912.1 hypothetical protein [Vibrio parahaemolyticus]
MATKTKKINTSTASSSSAMHIEIKEQVETLFSQQRNLVVKLRSKSVKVNIKTADSNSALEWL